MLPGYPQDDMMMKMIMGEAVAKSENNNLPLGWSASLQGMMALVRVLPADQYEKLMIDIMEDQVDKSQSQPEHHHHE